jgi:transcriptional accessory protein Tex/SPT6
MARATGSQDDIKRYFQYINAGATPPPEFDGLVLDNTTPRGPFLREQTAEERSAAEEAAKAYAQGLAEDERFRASLRSAAAKGAVTSSGE